MEILRIQTVDLVENLLFLIHTKQPVVIMYLICFIASFIDSYFSFKVVKFKLGSIFVGIVKKNGFQASLQLPKNMLHELGSYSFTPSFNKTSLISLQ